MSGGDTGIVDQPVNTSEMLVADADQFSLEARVAEVARQGVHDGTVGQFAAALLQQAGIDVGVQQVHAAGMAGLGKGPAEVAGQRP